MENEKLFEFMEKMYSDITKRFDNLEGVVKGLKQGQEGTNKRLTKIETTIESIDTRLKDMAEVQETNYAENEKHHVEIVEMLSKRLDTQDAVIKNNIKAVK